MEDSCGRYCWWPGILAPLTTERADDPDDQTSSAKLQCKVWPYQDKAAAEPITIEPVSRVGGRSVDAMRGSRLARRKVALAPHHDDVGGCSTVVVLRCERSKPRSIHARVCASKLAPKPTA